MIEIVIHKPQQLLRDHNTETINSSDFFVENGQEQSFEQRIIIWPLNIESWLT